MNLVKLVELAVDRCNMLGSEQKIKLLLKLSDSTLEVGCDSRPAVILSGRKEKRAAASLERLGLVEVKELSDKTVAYLNHTKKHELDDWEGAWERATGIKL